jgi:hypothetical protein
VLSEKEKYCLYPQEHNHVTLQFVEIMVTNIRWPRMTYEDGMTQRLSTY